MSVFPTGDSTRRASKLTSDNNIDTFKGCPLFTLNRLEEHLFNGRA